MRDLLTIFNHIEAQVASNANDRVREDSPRGFYCVGSCDPKYISAFARAFSDPDNDNRSWVVKRSALRLAKLMMGDNFREWCRKSVTTGSYHQRNDDFLVDTLRFIHTGNRSLSVRSWKDLLPGVLDSERVDQLYRVKRESFPYPVPYSMSECLSLWCAHPKGLEDMVCTLDVLFGDAREDLMEYNEPVFRIRL